MRIITHAYHKGSIREYDQMSQRKRDTTWIITIIRCFWTMQIHKDFSVTYQKAGMYVTVDVRDV